MQKIKLENIKDLCEYIWYLEDKYDLFNLEINGVHPWAAFRIDLYYEIGKRHEIFDKDLNMKLSRSEKVINLFRLLKQSLINNPRSNLHQVNTLVFSHSRSKLVNKRFIDPYTYYLKEDLIKNNTSFLEFESPYKGKHLREKKSYKRYLDSILIFRNIKDLFINIKITKKDEQTLDNLSIEIKSNNDDLNIRDFLIRNTRKFIPTYAFYYNLLKKTQPKEIFIVVSYGKGELIKAANDLNIEVIELQHGTISKYHLGYSFPSKINKLYFPSKFYVWNQYWKELLDFPIEQKNIIVFPFQYLETEKDKYNIENKKKNSLIVFSQGGITDKITDKITENIMYFQKFNITFKLHPNEYHMISKYKNLIYLQKKYNIKVVTNIDLYEYLAKSEYQAGVFSTALYEGIEFNCKTILLDVPGIEYMDKFIIKYNPIII